MGKLYRYGMMMDELNELLINETIFYVTTGERSTVVIVQLRWGFKNFHIADISFLHKKFIIFGIHCTKRNSCLIQLTAILYETLVVKVLIKLLVKIKISRS